MKFDFSNDAMKAMEKIDAKAAGRIIKGIMGLPSKGDIKSLQGCPDIYRLRIGDYRILFKILNGNGVLIEKVESRGDVYKGV